MEVNLNCCCCFSFSGSYCCCYCCDCFCFGLAMPLSGTYCWGGGVGALVSLLIISVHSPRPLGAFFSVSLLGCSLSQVLQVEIAGTQFCQVTYGTTRQAVGMVALHDHEDTLSTSEHIWDLIELLAGQCHHELVVTGDNAFFTPDEGYLIHWSLSQ